nr:putative disease resistance rpp13-like protein 1 [Quercus suber]
MAGALVGGAFLSAFLQVAFDRLASRDFRDFFKGRKDIDGSLKKLKMLLRSAYVVLVDAEDNQYTNPDVKEWLDDLQDAVYDADDLLDEIALRCKLQAESQTGTSEVRNFITAFVDSFDKEIPFKLEKILADLDSIIDQMGINKLPITIDNLVHLRYLNSCYTGIKDLPDSLCNLYNLQTLILSSDITKLPTNMSKLINLRHLDNSGAWMKEMPPQMGKMKNLRKLSVFGVGIHDDGSSIKELGELQHLSGKLSLLNLENVQCINKENTEVILKNKQDLSELELKWKHRHGAEDSEKERILLEQLCPCTNLNSLTITNYEGTSFPKWLGDSSFSKMVSIELSDCDNCFSLPPLGQLPDLKSLRIEYFGKILSVGLEFYGNTINPFRALEYLSFKNMPEWQEWVLLKGEVFTCLRELYIEDCPKLIGGLPVQLPSLTKLDICECKQLVASLPNSPALHQLLLSYTGKIEGGVYSILPFPPFASLSRLEICECPDLVSFPSGGLSAPNLSEIVISMCENLKSLPEGMHTLLPSLVRLDLGWCTELESFPEGGLPSSLESLAICRCEKLISRRMALGLQGLHSLKSFTISNYHNELESFPEEALLPPNLTDFTIGYLPNLKSLNGKGFQLLNSLKNLSIWNCHSLDCLLEDVLPTSLYQLQISCCCFLKERYGNEKGEGRVKIAHISRISIS